MRIKPTLHVLILAFICTALVPLSATTSSAQQTVSDSAKPAAQPQGTITGRVVSSSGESLSGATVYLSTLGVAAPPRSAMVDASGNFKLDGLEAGSYSIWASVPGFVSDNPVLPNEQRRYYHPGDSPTFTLTKGGVITGTVTNSTNTPVINATVRAYRVRDANGQPVQGALQAGERWTDDRGVYRLYGLVPGSYVISAGGPGRSFGFGGNQYENDAPTYAPSSTRDTALEIFVRGGEEIAADIQYRGEPGHSISGAVAGFPEAASLLPSNVVITLTDVRSRASITSASTSAFNGYGFALYGIADGEYELVAQRYAPASGEVSGSEPRRVKVQGADLTGINLNLAPLASIAGRLILESSPPADCVKRRLTANQETAISARRFTPDPKPPARPAAKPPATSPEVPINSVNQIADAVADAKGDFNLRNLRLGSYRIDPQLPEAGWYLRSISIGAAPAAFKASDLNVARDGVTLKSGERVAGLTVTIAEGAARLRGRISAPEGQRVPTGLRVYLVPAERDNAENVLRFFEASTGSDATFAIGNIAPGRYWIIARGADEGDPTKVKPIRQESALRARVLHEAEALKKEISFKPCERSADYDLPYSLATSPKQ
jgi:hypothetical protein